MDQRAKLPKIQCTGCGACVNRCEMVAIRMEPDRRGFLYPHIDPEKCNGCGECMAVCEMCGSHSAVVLGFPVVYAMQSRDKEVRIHSTSGGIFSELAACILRGGGGVCGAVYREDWSVEHSMVWDPREMENIRRSKYQQSSTKMVYREIRAALERKKEILFCGTPCQAAGLKAFLGKEYHHLYICDLICRGVSSPRIFSEYAEDLKRRYASEITYVWMKNKCNGWHSLTTVIGFENGETYVRKGLNDSFAQLYLKYNTGIRESCYSCRFKKDRSAADITLGDFWGLEGTDMDDNLGTSAVICRTPKGLGLIDRIRKNVFFREMSLEDIIKANPCLYNPVEQSLVNTGQFYDVMEKEGYQQAIKWIAENVNG